MAGGSQTSWALTWVRRLHGAFVSQRRTRVLAEALAARIPGDASVLDIGCGDGIVASLIQQIRRDVSIQGVEYQVRPGCRIECHAFDGSKLPFPDGFFDVCMLVDVLHHTQDPAVLLREAARVGRSSVLIKDHLDENFLDHVTLRFMDWVGNRPHGVVLTYNYQSRKQWLEYFSKCGLREERWTCDVPLYQWPFGLIVGRKLHFVASLEKLK